MTGRPSTRSWCGAQTKAQMTRGRERCMGRQKGVGRSPLRHTLMPLRSSWSDIESFGQRTSCDKVVGIPAPALPPAFFSSSSRRSRSAAATFKAKSLRSASSCAARASILSWLACHWSNTVFQSHMDARDSHADRRKNSTYVHCIEVTKRRHSSFPRPALRLLVCRYQRHTMFCGPGSCVSCSLEDNPLRLRPHLHGRV